MFKKFIKEKSDAKSEGDKSRSGTMDMGKSPNIQGSGGDVSSTGGGKDSRTATASGPAVNWIDFLQQSGGYGKLS
jgi:hypothetical protein